MCVEFNFGPSRSMITPALYKYRTKKQLAACNRVLLGKLIVAQMIKTFLAITNPTVVLVLAINMHFFSVLRQLYPSGSKSDLSQQQLTRNTKYT